MRLSVLLAATFCFAASASAQRPLNLDFEMCAAADSTQPWGWSRGWSAFQPGPTAEFSLDAAVREQGLRSLRITASDSAADAPERSMILQVSADVVRGATLVLTGTMRVADMHGRAVISLEAWGDRVVVAADSAQIDNARRETPWQRFSLRITVPRDPAIHSFVIIPAVQGRGTAWFDDLELTRDGTRLSHMPGVAAPSAAQLRWLGTHSVPLTTLNASATSVPADLVQFDHIVGDAKIIGLGESTHGTSEFFTEKHRLIRHLVEQRGVRVFALEANQRAVAALDRYVREGVGSARQALRTVYAVWNTEEMLGLIEWLRAYNVAHPQAPVHVVGYDMQDHRQPSDSLLAYLDRHDAPLRARVAALSETYRAERSFAVPQAPDSLRARWLSDADTIVALVRARRGRWLTAASTAADSTRVEWALHDADLYRQAARLNASLASPDRDSLMAANLAWTMRTLHPDARAVVWAHDLHVSHGGDRQRSFNAGAQMGAVLKHAYRMDYRALSLLTRRGQYTGTRSFTDYRMMAAEAFPAPEGSVESVLASLPHPPQARGVIVDLRVRENDPTGGWLWTPRPVRSIGYTVYDYGFEMAAIMPLEFDGVILIDETRASRLLP
jgi:erythromycin esterase